VKEHMQLPRGRGRRGLMDKRLRMAQLVLYAFKRFRSRFEIRTGNRELDDER